MAHNAHLGNRAFVQHSRSSLWIWALAISIIPVLASAQSCPDAEPNNFLSEASAPTLDSLPDGSKIYEACGTVAFGNDSYDWYAFTPPGNASFLVEVNATHSNPLLQPGQIAAVFSLYNSTGSPQGMLLPNGYENVPNGSGANWMVGRRGVGTYYFRLQANQPIGGDVSYTVTITADTLSMAMDYEPNGSPSEAITAALNSSVQGHIGFQPAAGGPPDSYDHYRFHVTEPGLLSVKLNMRKTSFDAGTIYPSLALDAAIFAGQTDTPRVEILVEDTGFYGLQITQLGNAPPGCEYILTSTFTPRFINLRVFNSKFGDNTLLVSSNTDDQSLFRVCADKSKATIFEITCTACRLQNIIASLSSDPNSTNLGLSGGIQSGSDYSLSPNGDTLLAAFTHPAYLSSGFLPYREDTLLLIDINSGDTLLRNPFRVYRAPLLFVHGLAASSSTFSNAEADLVSGGLYPGTPTLSPLTLRADYSPSHDNLKRFHVNRRVVPKAINQLLDQALERGYSAGRADVVGHSMGGILTRLYAQSSWSGVPYRDDIHKIITVNTPHYGTQSANYWLDNESVLPGILGLISSGFSTGLDFAANVGFLGAIKDLRVNSRPTRLRLNIPQADQPAIPAATIATDGVGDLSGMGIAAQLLMGYAIVGQNLYDGDFSDIVVPRGSQTSSLSPHTLAFQQWHSGASSNPDVISGLAELLSANPSSTAFTTSGFPPNELEYFAPQTPDQLSIPNDRAVGDSVTIDSPLPGAAFSPNDLVTVDITYTSNVTQLALIITGPSIQPISIDTVAVSLLQFTVPSNALGTLTMFLLGGDGSNWIANDESLISISSSIAPDSISAGQPAVTIPLGIVHQFHILGYFSGNPPVLLSGSSELTSSIDTTLLDSVGIEAYQAVQLGVDTIVFSYLGITDTVVASIVDDPSALVSAFDWAEDIVCANEPIQFVDQSIGLATGYQWSFPGGSPSSSTDANPVVGYQTSGVYGASLITTFVNGSDTLVLDSLIEVLAIDTSVTLSDGTLLAGAEEATYHWLDCSDGFTPIPNAIDSVFTPTANGFYALAVTQGGCTDTSACYQVLTTGVGSYATEGATILPNPNDGTFVLDLAESNSTVLIEITDMTGRVVHRELAQNTRRLHIQLEGSAGSYLVNVTTPEKRFVLPLVKR